MNKREKNTVKLTLDLSKRPVITEAQQARLKALEAMPDDKIDYSDAPPVPDGVWAKAHKLPEPKQQITLRLDADILEFFKHNGSRYQTRINAVLRSYVEAHKEHG